MSTHLLVELITVPLFMGAIGYVTNWSGVLMLFQPLSFHGVKVPGLASLAKILPRRWQQVPGVMHGGVGWQGIIPSRVAKMGSISVDKGIAKLGNASDFYQQLEPDRIAEHVLASSENDLRDLVEGVMEREDPRLWRDLPETVREAIHARVHTQLPDIVHEVTERIGDNIDQLLDVKHMVIRRLEERPELGNRVFQEVGEKELKFMINFGFFFAFVLGFPVVAVTETFDHWWVLPIMGTLVGWATNLIGIRMIFEPVEERRILGIRIQGLFIRRQQQVADIYSAIIAHEIVTLSAVADELVEGPRADRTRKLIEDSMRPAIDRAVGPLRGAVRLAIGSREYDSIKESMASEVVRYTITPLGDPAFNRRQSEAVRVLIRDRMREMDPHDYVEMLRTAIKQDEWLLFLHGAVLGFGAGLLHLAIFG